MPPRSGVAPRRRRDPWSSIDARELMDSSMSGSAIQDNVPACSAVYSWRLKLEPDCSTDDTHAFLQHLQHIAQLPQGRLGRTSLSRAVQLEGLILGGTGLSERKLADFRRLLADREMASSIREYLRSLQERIPALYVGKARNLPTRVSQHLAGVTGFGSSISNDSRLQWSDLRLEYFKLGDADAIDDSTLESFEQLMTVLMIAPYTERAG